MPPPPCEMYWPNTPCKIGLNSQHYVYFLIKIRHKYYHDIETLNSLFYPCGIIRRELLIQLSSLQLEIQKRTVKYHYILLQISEKIRFY